MKWSERSVYLYLVSFASLLILVFGVVQLVNGLIDLYNPDGRFGVGKPYTIPLEPGGEPGGQTAQPRETTVREAYAKLNPELSLEQVQAMARERLAEEQRYETVFSVYYKARSLLRSFTLTLIALPVYLYHWRRAGRTA